MKATDLREKSEAELAEMEHDLRQELFLLRMKHFTGQLQRVSELKEKRRDIARILSVIREKQLAS